MHEFIGSSPLSFVGGEAQQQQYQQQQQQYTAPTIEPPTESNAERNYRDAANFCEVVAPAALGSAVVFAFHSMQVAGGSIVAIGIYQIYLAAKLTGQSSGRWTSAIVGVGVTGSMIFALTEPIGESQQASEVKDRIGTAIKELQINRKIDARYFDYLPSIALAIIVLCLFLKFKGMKQCR
jgi:hypothetical protein